MGQGHRPRGVSADAISHCQIIWLLRVVPGEKKHQLALVRCLRALVSSYRFLRVPAVRDKVMRAIVEAAGSSEGIARQSFARYVAPDRGVVPKKGEIDVKVLGEVIHVMAEVRELNFPLTPAEKLIDLQYLKTAGCNCAPV